MLRWVKAFNRYDLYSKGDGQPDVKALRRTTKRSWTSSSPVRSTGKRVDAVGRSSERHRRRRALRALDVRPRGWRSASSAAASPGSSASGSSPTTSAWSPTPPTRSRRPSASRTCCRTCSAKARCRRRSSRCTRRCWRAASARRPTRVAGAVVALLALVRLRAGAGRRSRPRRGSLRAIAPGFTGAKRELTITLVRDPVSRRRPAGAVGVVPRRPEQPPQVPAVVRGAGDVERRDDRDARVVRPRAHAAEQLAVLPGVGVGGRQRAAVRACSCRSVVVARRRPALCARHHLGARARGRPQLRAGVHQPRRRADQRVRRRAARQPAADRRRHRPRPTRSCSTRCRSACSACRSRRRSCRRCRARRHQPATDALRARLDTRPAPDRVLRRALGDGVPRARRHSRGRAAPDRPVHAMATPCTSGACWRDRRSDCSRRRSAACTRPRTTRCATRERRCVTPSCASCSRPCSATSSR